MKKTNIALKPLTLKKEIISDLEAKKVLGAGPVTTACNTILGPSCLDTCQRTCTLDGTIASQYVSNCCPAG